MITPCPNACPECPFYEKKAPKPLQGTQEHRCFSDTDHIIPRFMGRIAGASTLLKNYIRSTANQQQLCRWEHDQKTIDEWNNPPIIPSEAFMISAIKESRRRRKLKNQARLNICYNNPEKEQAANG